ncbi:MAG TPA: hypothetical protein VN017_09180, partial [Pseudoxanthomonas sp.]|nr:hypothetical protein [Pseudoxanthomonas sp.]
AAQADAQQAAAKLKAFSDQGLLQSFGSEEQLQRVFTERRQMLEDNLRTARFNLVSLRGGLIALLDQASSRELAGKPVIEQMQSDIRTRHAELARQQALLVGFTRDRAALDGEIAETLARYRALKAGSGGATDVATQAASPANQ